jgi:hypothetical protein
MLLVGATGIEEEEKEKKTSMNFNVFNEMFTLPYIFRQNYVILQQ